MMILTAITVSTLAALIDESFSQKTLPLMVTWKDMGLPLN